MNRTQIMRQYVSKQLNGMNVDALSTEQLDLMIEGYYEGGLDAWALDYLGHVLSTSEVTQIRLRARFRDVTGRVLPSCQNVISMRRDDTTGHIIIALECSEGRDGKTRQTITGRTLRLSVFDGWAEVERIEIDDASFHTETTVGQYGTVNTPERYAGKLKEYLECYRPGTDISPMDGCYGPTRKDTFRDERAQFKKTLSTIAPEVSV